MKEAPSTARGTWLRVYCWTETGYLDADTFKAVLDKVAELWHMHNPGIPALLFSDQLAAHRRADIVEHAIGLGLYLFSLPKNTSHITQPLDEEPFDTLQVVTRDNREAAVMDGMFTNSGTRDALLMAAYAAERRAFTRPVISGALRPGVVMAQDIQECPGPPSEDGSSSCDEGGASSGDEIAE
eukprot:contig_16239_g3928